MSGLYNALFSTDNMADELLAMLGTSRGEVPRFRDCYLTEEGIVIHTRTGGDNREAYEDEAAYLEYFGVDGDEPIGPFNSDLYRLPGFIRDEDCDFDCTYANFYYAVPEAFAERARAWLAEHGAPMTPGQKWGALFEALRGAEAAPAGQGVEGD